MWFIKLSEELLHVVSLGIEVCGEMLTNHIDEFPKKYQYTIHNLIGHPLSEIAHLLGEDELSEWIHMTTCPRDNMEE